MRKIAGLVLVLASLRAANLTAAERPPRRPLPRPSEVLWYQRPAARWLEALPVGNGRLGAMVFGGVAEERIALNESTFWSGAPDPSQNNPEGRGHLAEIRKLLFEGDFRKGIDLVSRDMLGREGNYGTHLPVGDLLIEMEQPAGDVRDYRRELSLDRGVASVRYEIGGVGYRRAVYASHPDQIIVARFSADQPGKVSFRARFKANGETGRVVTRNRDTLVITEEARERKHSNGQTGVSLGGLIRAVAEGGAVTARDGMIEVREANAVTLLIALDTTFLLHRIGQIRHHIGGAAAGELAPEAHEGS